MNAIIALSCTTTPHITATVKGATYHNDQATGTKEAPTGICDEATRPQLGRKRIPRKHMSFNIRQMQRSLSAAWIFTTQHQPNPYKNLLKHVYQHHPSTHTSPYIGHMPGFLTWPETLQSGPLGQLGLYIHIHKTISTNALDNNTSEHGSAHYNILKHLPKSVHLNIAYTRPPPHNQPNIFLRSHINSSIPSNPTVTYPHPLPCTTRTSIKDTSQATSHKHPRLTQHHKAP